MSLKLLGFRLRSQLGFGRNKQRSVRESIANVEQTLTCSFGPKRRKTRVVKEVELFSEFVELGGRGFRVGGSLSLSASVSRWTCATMKVMMNIIHCSFLLDESCATPRKDKFSYPFAFQDAVSVRRRVLKNGGRHSTGAPVQAHSGEGAASRGGNSCGR